MHCSSLFYTWDRSTSEMVKVDFIDHMNHRDNLQCYNYPIQLYLITFATCKNDKIWPFVPTFLFNDLK